MLRKSHILFFISVFGLVSLCLTYGFADDDVAILEGDPFAFPTADGPEYFQGTAEFQRAPENIIGTPDFEKMRDLPPNSQDYRLGTKVGWIIIPSRSIPNRYWVCTGFLVGPDLFMTAHHCIHDNLGLRPLGGARIYMDYYQEPSVDRTRGGITARVSALLRADARKDYALLRLDTPIGDTYGWLDLDATTRVNASHSVKIIGHPDGRSKEIVRRNSQIVVLPPHVLPPVYLFFYLADTVPGSSGSPVFLRDGTGVIGIHTTGFRSIRTGDPIFNGGTLMSHIVPEIQQWLPGGSPPPPTLTATTLEVVSGDGQSASAGSQIANPLVVRVRDQNSDAMSGVSVSFSVRPSGQVIPSSATTGTNGEAQTRLTLGSTAGTYTVTARATGITQSVTFTATGTTAPVQQPVATTLEVVSGEGQSAPVNQQLASPLVVRGKDQNDDPMSGVSVSFSVTPSGQVIPSSATTGTNGEAQTQLTLGNTAGTYTVTARATGITQSVTFTATGTAPALAFNPPTIADQTFRVDTPITPLTLPLVTGGTAPYTYRLSAAPAGLVFDSAKRELSGTPTTPGTTNATYTATDASQQNASLRFTITVTPAPLTFNPATIANQTFTVGTPITPLILPPVTGGTAPYTYRLLPIPAGLAFDSAKRELSSTPTTSGTTNVTYTATDANEQNASLTFTVRVIAPLTFNPSTIAEQAFTTGTAVNLVLPIATGGTAPYTYTLSPIPAGLSFTAASRTLNGTPTTSGTTNVTYTATDASRQNVSLTFTITVSRVDVNGDGVVDVVDLTIAALTYGTRVPEDTRLPADVNSDGVVNLLDLTLVAQAIDAAGGGATGVSLADIAVVLEAVAEAPNAVSGGDLAYRNVATALTDARLEKGIPETLLQTLQRLLLEMRAIPETTALLPNYPNPFNPETWIPYHLAKDAEVTLTIYSVRGEVVRELTLGHQAAGVYESRGRAAYWDGRNAQGEPVASGVYFYTLTAGDFTATRKLLIAK